MCFLIELLDCLTLVDIPSASLSSSASCKLTFLEGFDMDFIELFVVDNSGIECLFLLVFVMFFVRDVSAGSLTSFPNYLT